ncbi:hypothetical protein RUND412_008531 [Rhizina undulata]
MASQGHYRQPPAQAQSQTIPSTQGFQAPQPNVGHNPVHQTSPAQPQSVAPMPPSDSQALTTKIDLVRMEQEMRDMVERMRHYQNIDPQTFHSVWENVKKSSSSAGAITAGAANLEAPPQPAESKGVVTAPSAVSQGERDVVNHHLLHDASVGASGGMPKPPRAHPSSSVQSQPVNSNIGHNGQLASPPQPHQNLGHSPQAVPRAQAPKSAHFSHATSPPATAAPGPDSAASVWPEAQKREIANVTVDFLAKSTGRTLSPGTVMGLLEKHKNFVTLCESIESMQFVFDRGKFARRLLQSAERAPKEVIKPTVQRVSVEGGARVLGEVEESQEQLIRESNEARRNHSPAPPQQLFLPQPAPQQLPLPHSSPQQLSLPRSAPQHYAQPLIQPPIQPSPGHMRAQTSIKPQAPAPVQVPAPYLQQTPAHRIMQSPPHTAEAGNRSKSQGNKEPPAATQAPQLATPVPFPYPHYPHTPMSGPPMAPVAPMASERKQYHGYHPPPMYYFPTTQEHNQFVPPHANPQMYYYPYPYPPPQPFFHGPPQTPVQYTAPQYHPPPTPQGAPQFPNNHSNLRPGQPVINQHLGQATQNAAFGNNAVSTPSEVNSSLVVKLPLKRGKGARPDSEDEDPSFIDDDSDPTPLEPRASPRPARVIPKEVEIAAPEPEADDLKRPRIVVVPGRIRRRTLSEMEVEAENVVKATIEIPARRKKAVAPVAPVVPVAPNASVVPVIPVEPLKSVKAAKAVKEDMLIAPISRDEPSIAVGNIEMLEAYDEGGDGDDEDDSDVGIFGGGIGGGDALATAAATATWRRDRPRTKFTMPVAAAAKTETRSSALPTVGPLPKRKSGRRKSNTVQTVEGTKMALDGVGGNEADSSGVSGGGTNRDYSQRGTCSRSTNGQVTESGSNTPRSNRAGGGSQQGFTAPSRRTPRVSSGLRHVTTPGGSSVRAESSWAASSRADPAAAESSTERRRQTFAVVIYKRPEASRSAISMSDNDEQHAAKKLRVDRFNKSTPGASDTDQSHATSKLAMRNTNKQQRPPSVPQFRIYKCQWAECPAELHNYETLRDHVLKVHRKQMASGEYPCKWKDCFKSSANETEEQRLLTKFNDEQQWETHVREHLVQVKTVYGLGPEGGFSDPEPLNSDVDFCSDAEGRQITPWVTLAPPGYHWTPPPGFRANEAFNSLHGIIRKRASGASTPAASRIADIEAYNAEYARATKLGAGMETNEADDLLENDDGTGLFYEHRIVINIEDKANKENAAQDDSIAANNQLEAGMIRDVIKMSMEKAGDTDSQEEEGEGLGDEAPETTPIPGKIDKGKQKAIEVSDDDEYMGDL